MSQATKTQETKTQVTKSKAKAKRPSGGPRARRWALTLWTKPDFVMDTDVVRYFVAGEEICPDTGRTHWQAYIELFKVVRLNALKEILDDEKAHCAPARGNPTENITYCKKDGKVYREEGTPSKATQGKRTDLIALRTHFQNKRTEREAIETDELLLPVAKYPRLVNKLSLLYSVERSWVTELHVFWGPPGTGKSHTAFEEAKQLGTIYFKPEGQWWDGYEGQEVVIFEDFRGETGLATLLRLADKYPMRVAVKGGFAQFVAKRIYITSNLDVDDWFNQEQRGYSVSIAALRRRITRKVHFDTPFTSNQ